MHRSLENGLNIERNIRNIGKKSGSLRASKWSRARFVMLNGISSTVKDSCQIQSALPTSLTEQHQSLLTHSALKKKKLFLRVCPPSMEAADVVYLKQQRDPRILGLTEGLVASHGEISQ